MAKILGYSDLPSGFRRYILDDGTTTDSRVADLAPELIADSSLRRTETSEIIDLGVVTMQDILDNGPKTVYVPDGLTSVELDFLNDDSSVDIDAGSIAFPVFGNSGGSPIFVGMNSGGFAGGNVYGWSAFVTVAVSNGLVRGEAGAYISDPVVAAFGSINTLLSPLGTWTAHKLYRVGDGILDNAGDVQIVTVGGTSGATIPSFDDSGSTTPGDGGVTWQDNGLAPTQGAVHMVAKIGKVHKQ